MIRAMISAAVPNAPILWTWKSLPLGGTVLLFGTVLAARTPLPYTSRARPPCLNMGIIHGGPGTDTVESGENDAVHDNDDGPGGGGQ